MPTLMPIDGVEAQVEYDPDQDHFYGVAELGPGPIWDGREMISRTITFYGRSPRELRRRFRQGQADLGG